MTQEQHQNSSQAPMLTDELPIIRRSRSLSELPGHIRVPILRRQDTARTQARLEAGAAGVKELRVLREHQQQMFDQTMSASHQKRKQPTQQRLTHTMAEHHRLQHKQHIEHTNQQMHNCCSPISAWHSTSHLASISEERDSTPNAAAKKYVPENSVNVASNSNYQETTKNTFANKKFIGNFKDTFDSTHYQAQSQSQSLLDKNKCNTQHRSLENNLHHHKVQNHSPEKSFKSSTVKTDEQTSADKHKTATHDEIDHKNYVTMHTCSDDKESKTTKQYVNTRSRSMSQGFIQCRDNRHAQNVSDICHNQNIYMKSAQNLSRDRSQSVNENFAYFCNSKENESECKSPHQSSIKNYVVHKVHNSQPHREDYVNRHMHHQDLQSLSNINSSPFHPLKMFSPQSQQRSKSISWDNLLVVIGLQNESTEATNEIKDQSFENNDDVFINSPHVADVNNDYLASTEIEKDYIFQIKKMRSQSFTSGCALIPDSKSAILNIEHHGQNNNRKNENVSCKKTGAEANVTSEIVKRHYIIHHRQTTKEINSTSLLRRASIQCEAVLTQTGTPKRILNPLQDVDINSLQSPGPLHAVTLQYTSMTMRNASDSCVITTSNKSVAPKEKLIPTEISKSAQASCSVAASNAYHSPHLITESGHSSEQLSQTVLFKSENSKVDKTDPCNSKIFQQNSPKKHPIPRPRTSILKASSEQTKLHANYSTAAEISEMNNKTHVIESKTSLNEEYSPSRDTKSDADQLQNSVVSDLPVINSSSPSLVPNKQPTYLTNMKSTLCSNSENQRLLTESKNKELSNFIQSTNLSCSVAESDKTESCSVSESRKTEVKTQKEQDRRSSNILEILSVWVNSHRVNKANSDLNGDIPLMKPATESINKSVNALPNMPSCNYMDHLNEVESEKTNGSKSSCCLPHQKQFPHTPDVTILSDEGYSTCDSISQQSQLFIYGQHQPSDIHSPSCGSIANMGFLGDLPCSPDHSGSSFQTQCLPSNVQGLNDLKCNANKEARAHNFDLETARISNNGGTECYTRDPAHLSVKQDNTVISELDSSRNYGNTSAAVNHNCHSTGKETVVATKLSNQVTSTDKDECAAIVDNNKDGKDGQFNISVAKIENKDGKDGQMNISVAKLENKEHTDEEVKCVSSHSNDSVENIVKDIKRSFKQTAV